MSFWRTRPTTVDPRLADYREVQRRIDRFFAEVWGVKIGADVPPDAGPTPATSQDGRRGRTDAEEG